MNNATKIYMTGFGFDSITADRVVFETLFALLFEFLFLIFVVYAAKKLHWFDEV
jgi:hypothetical protein